MKIFSWKKIICVKIVTIGDIMKNKRLIIKYKGKYICEKVNGEIDFIKIPDYIGSTSDFSNIDIFVSLLCSNCLNDSYETTRGFTYQEELEVFEFLIQMVS